MEPLAWPQAWVRMSSWDRFVLGFPNGVQARTRKDLLHQLEARGPEGADSWLGHPGAELEALASSLLRENMDWPERPFLPDDPLEILLWDHTGYPIDNMAAEAFVQELEIGLNVSIPDEFLQRAVSGTYGEFLVGIRGLLDAVLPEAPARPGSSPRLPWP